MIKVLLVAPYLQCKNEADEVFGHWPDSSITFITIYAVGVKFIETLQVDCDAIIARGATAAAFQEAHPHIPVINLPVTSYDVLAAVHECRERLRAEHIAIMGADALLYGVQRVAGILGVRLECHKVTCEEDAAACVEQAKKNGVCAVISGAMTVDIARRNGMNAVLIESGKEAILQAAQEAVRTARVAKQNQAITERMKAIMNYAYEGIVAVDEKGLITVFNQTAAELSGMNAQAAVGRPVREVLPQTGLLRVLSTGQPELGELQNLNGVMVAKNRIPVKVKEKVVGAVATFQNVVQLQELEGRIRKKIHPKGLKAKYCFADMIGESDVLAEVIDRTRKFSAVDSNVLITGETGTGKELLAQSCHNSSKRRFEAFVAVNCAALPENLLESELFGYVEGAFTGAAKAGKAGLFELAHQGTIFLDEVSEIPVRLQGRLLRVLQEREIMRLGDDRVLPVDVRVIAATNRDLKKLADQNVFRRDLLYRLDVLHIQIPPLRRRTADIVALLRHYFAVYNQKFGKTLQHISPDAEKLLLSYEWPGNVRELRNICEQLAVLIDGDTVRSQDVCKVLAMDEKHPMEANAPVSGIESVQNLDGETIERMLIHTAGNKTKAAELLGISRTTLWRKLSEQND